MIGLGLVALAAVLVFAYTAQTVTGFGSVIIAVTLAAHFWPIPVILALVIPLSIAQCGYLALRHRGSIDRPLLCAHILPFMGLGVIAGLAAAPYIEGTLLRTLFAVMVLVLSLLELTALLRPQPDRPAAALGRGPLAGMLVGAGVIHGIYGAGGPMLVYAVNRAGLSKSSFRTTLLAVWIPFAVILTASYLRAGIYHGDTLQALALVAPAVPIGIWLGEYLHHRVDEHRFRVIAFTLLAAAAISLLVR